MKKVTVLTFLRHFVANSIVPKLPNRTIKGFQSVSDYCWISNAVLKHLAW